MRRGLLIALSFIGSAVLLWLVLRNVPFTDIIAGIRQASPFWLLVNFIFTTLSLWTRGIRWRGLLDDRVPVRESFLLMSIGMMLNQLPLRAGEIARSAIVTRFGVSFVTSLTSIVIERILDLLAVVLVIALTLPFVPGASPDVGRAAFTLGLVALAGFGTLIFFARRPDVPHRLLDILNRLLPFFERVPLRRLLDNVLLGLQPLTNRPRFIHAIVWTFICWVTSFLALYSLTMALNLPENVRWFVTFLGVGFTAIGLAVPLSVASLGPFQAAMVFVGQLVGVDNITAITLGFLFNGMAVMAYVGWGTVGMLSLGLSLGDLLKQQPPPEPAVE